MTENWNLNKRNYAVEFGEPQDFGLQVEVGFFLRRQFVAQIVCVDNLEIFCLQVNFIGSPILEIAGSYDQIGRMMSEINFGGLAKHKIQRFLIGDRAQWLKNKNIGIWILGLQVDKARRMEIENLLGEEKMQIEWSQIIRGKQDGDIYIVDEVGQVFINQYEIDKAQKLGGNPLVELQDATSSDSDIRQYVVTRFIPRSADSQRVAMKDAKRLSALRQIYEATDGLIQRDVKWSIICDKDLLTEEEAEDILSFLIDRGLVEYRNMLPSLGLTRLGSDEIEDAIRNPRNQTHSFPASAVQYIMNNVNVSGGNIGAIQAGNNSQADIKQNIGVNGQELIQLFSQMRQEIQQLPNAQRVEALEHLEDLETESTNAEPKKSRLKSSGKALLELASGVFSSVSIAYLNKQLGIEN